ncbi:MAG: Unknown protein [uncultured Thiotrichaceae bacterium]|uniref:Uncharacterized protein n=1 Tax=uncultured Thiotrichaceae bacterium TaxID=298394 RepID=A0A6S6TJK0_9GAMM|nr:MAG: Unknown protein [uncultured Thiotrichaceae bacterium]
MHRSGFPISLRCGFFSCASGYNCILGWCVLRQYSFGGFKKEHPEVTSSGQFARTWSVLCFSGFVAHASASLRLGPRFRNKSPKNSGVCRWWLSGRLCCAALAAGVDRLGLVAPALKSSSRFRCENNPPEFRPYCPAMKLRRGRNADNFRCSRFFRPWLRCH